MYCLFNLEKSKKALGMNMRQLFFYLRMDVQFKALDIRVRVD